MKNQLFNQRHFILSVTMQKHLLAMLCSLLIRNDCCESQLALPNNREPERSHVDSQQIVTNQLSSVNKITQKTAWNIRALFCERKGPKSETFFLYAYE